MGGDTAPAPLALSRLPRGVVGQVADFVPRGDLPALMATSKKYHSAVRSSPMAWRKFVAMGMHGIDPAVANYDVCREIVQLRRQVADAPTVISAGLYATSTDYPDREPIHETLNNKISSYWCSGGDDHEHGVDSITFLLAGDLALVDRIALTFFHAYFQTGCPIYSAPKVKVYIGSLGEGDHTVLKELELGTERAGMGPPSAMRSGGEDDTKALVENACWHYESDEFDLEKTANTQTVHLDRLVAGSLLKLEFIGKHSRQTDADDDFYLCVQSVRAYGRTLPQLSPALAAAAVGALEKKPGHQKYVAFLDGLRQEQAAGEQKPAAQQRHVDPMVAECEHARRLQANPVVSHSQRGEDSKLTVLTREFYLYQHYMTDTYGSPEQRQAQQEQFRADMQTYTSLHNAVKRAQIEEAAQAAAQAAQSSS